MSHLKGFSVSLQFVWIWFFLMLSSHLQLQYICYEVTISTWNNRGVYFFGPFNHFPTRLKILPHNFPGYYAQTPLIIVFYCIFKQKWIYFSQIYWKMWGENGKYSIFFHKVGKCWISKQPKFLFKRIYTPVEQIWVFKIPLQFNLWQDRGHPIV